VFFLIQRFIAILFLIGFTLNPYSVAGAAEPKSETELEIVTYVRELFKARSQFLLSKDEKMLTPYYLSTKKASMYALKQEEIRKEYIHAWAAQRNIHFVQAESHIRIPRIIIEGDHAQVSIVQSQKLEYVHAEPFSTNQSFDVGDPPCPVFN
jgi:hypothetical protein